MRGLALNFASTHQTKNPLGFSEVGENKQLLIAIVVSRFFIPLLLQICQYYSRLNLQLVCTVFS
ncbi:hypothetical protein C7H52_12250 [Aurantibacter aestuarii]|uniref:Uncharacterized protein n=1 Tax=Aurantibacter aestuarii TaxID=1266046 RepID=A0A2T1N595_9FLAO|nr:hypothetical protein C7H52_12250 [Aurantibacter aestuarii]